MVKLSDLFFPASAGTCLFCGERVEVVRPTSSLALAGVRDAGVCDAGVCDVCSYALRHAWQREQGERIAALSPRLARTYVLLPRLREGRLAEDVSAYEFLASPEGGLPYAELARSPRDLVLHLARHYGVATWAETMRSCYLGYSGSSDFSEVVLPWAWGKQVGFGKLRGFVDFQTLLARPTPDAGFYLGVKAAFEAILWRREVGPEEGAPYTYMREPAVRYLAHQLKTSSGEAPEDDASMIEVFHGAMSQGELDVVSYLENLEEGKVKEAEVQKSGSRNQGSENRKLEDRGSENCEPGDDNVSPENVPGAPEGEVEDGFARPRSAISPPGEGPQ